jgi:hypothetical protein
VSNFYRFMYSFCWFMFGFGLMLLTTSPHGVLDLLIIVLCTAWAVGHPYVKELIK